jgi:CHAT domain-containing protein
MGEGTVLLDDEFTPTALGKLFYDDSFSVVHLATHGKFEGEAESTFLVTANDGRLTLDELERFIKPSQYRGQPVELLGLSACQTASGDARAGLGLAGVALKAGARSALATLWSINDEASAILVGKFYDELLQPTSLGKAKALQQAQALLLRDPRYRHPAYWSPYLIIGNWL